MGVLYYIGNMIGFFLVMIICEVLAVVFAKKKVLAWLLYGIGAGITLLSLIGQSNSVMISMVGGFIFSLWVWYVVLLVAGAVGIITRRKTAHSCECGARFFGNNCPTCGRPAALPQEKTDEPEVAYCSCGAAVHGKYCPVCGKAHNNK